MKEGIMVRYVFKRFLAMIATLYLIITITFFLMHAIPGGPFTLEKNVAPEVKEAMMQKYHLNEPVFAQYLNYLKRLFFRFDLGPSFKYEGMSVNKLIGMGFPVSSKVGFLAVLMVIAVGIPIGIAAAVYANRLPDRIAMFAATLGITIPSFVVSTVLLYIFSLKLGWLPTYGLESRKGYILPVLALGGYALSFISRLSRSSYLDVMQQDYMLLAKAKGLHSSRITIHYGLRNALIPVVTMLGPLIANLLTGSFVIEKVFALPGIGKYFVQSISNRDYTVIVGITIFYAAFLIAMVFIVDLLYGIINPQIKLDE